MNRFRHCLFLSRTAFHCALFLCALHLTSRPGLAQSTGERAPKFDLISPHLSGAPGVIVVGRLSDREVQEELAQLGEFVSARREFVKGCVVGTTASDIGRYDKLKVLVPIPDPDKAITSAYVSPKSADQTKIIFVSREGIVVAVKSSEVEMEFPAWLQRGEYNACASESFVSLLLKKNIMSRSPEGQLNPYGVVSQAEAAKMLTLAFNLPLEKRITVAPFTDVPVAHWAARYIDAVKNARIMNGDSAGKFHPGDNVTRAQAAVGVVRGFFKEEELKNLLQEKDLNLENHLKQIPGGSEVPAWASPYLAVAEFQGLLPPWAKIAYSEPATRSDFATMIARSLPESFTGLIIDAASATRLDSSRKTPKIYRVFTDKDSLLPGERYVDLGGKGRVLQQNYAEVYGVYHYLCTAPRTAERNQSNGTMAAYVESYEEAKKLRAGPHPLIIKAEGTRKVIRNNAEEETGTELIVGREDARKILAADQEWHFLNDWRVAVVKTPTLLAESFSPPDKAADLDFETPPALALKLNRSILEPLIKSNEKEACVVTADSGKTVACKIDCSKLYDGLLQIKLTEPLKSKTNYKITIPAKYICDWEQRLVRVTPESKPGEGSITWSFTTKEVVVGAINLNADREAIGANESCTVTVTLVDKEGRVAKVAKELKAERDAGSVDATLSPDTIKTSNGIAKIEIKANGKPGKIRLKVTCEDCADVLPETMTITVQE